jgi:formyltetrahydrofolate deformylase
VFHIDVGQDTLDDVKEKGLSLEANVLSKAVQLYLNEELVVVEGKVIFKPGISRFFHAREPAILSRDPRGVTS